MFTVVMVLRNDFKCHHASGVDKPTPHNSDTPARVLYKMRSMISQTLYRMFDAEIDSFEPTASHDNRSQNFHCHSFPVAEFLPFLSRLRQNLTGLTWVADLNSRNFVHGVVPRRSASVFDHIPIGPDFLLQLDRISHGEPAAHQDDGRH
jgi:hypothetical protein